MDIVMESFGPKRVMIGSDWPVCTLCGNYGKVMQVVTDYICQFSQEVQADILGGNCAHFYKMN
jgi:L-fuconolactonase